MKEQSKAVKDKISELYALMASAAAQRAVDSAKTCHNPFAANQYADAAIEWLGKSSANAIRWTYRQPRLNP